jgi:hypothetical protein
VLQSLPCHPLNRGARLHLIPVPTNLWRSVRGARIREVTLWNSMQPGATYY